MLQSLCVAFISNLVGEKVESRLGAVQVFRKGYIEADEPLKFALPTDPQLVARIARVSGVAAVAPRLEFDGLLANGAEATLFQATAIDPEREYQVCPKRQDKVAPGSLPLRAGQPGAMLVGKTLAESLGVDAGATLVMQAVGPQARTNAHEQRGQSSIPRHAVAPWRSTTRFRWSRSCSSCWSRRASSTRC